LGYSAVILHNAEMLFIVPDFLPVPPSKALRCPIKARPLGEICEELSRSPELSNLARQFPDGDGGRGMD
jgi:hypothetical protein